VVSPVILISKQHRMQVANRSCRFCDISANLLWHIMFPLSRRIELALVDKQIIVERIPWNVILDRPW